MKSKGKITNTIGMFDLIKGIIMLLIVFSHTSSLFPGFILNSTDNNIELDKLSLVQALFLLIINLLSVSLMPMLLIISGYGCRKRNIANSFRQNAKEMLKPYLYTSIATAIVHLCLHYAFFRYLPNSLTETAKVFGGAFYGTAQTTELANFTLFANGPVWFLLALFWSLSIFNIILNTCSQKHIPYFVFLLSIAGMFLGWTKYAPFCLSQGLVSVVYIYIGYYLKKSKFFQTEHTLKWKIAYLIIVIIPNSILLFFCLSAKLTTSEYPLGPITYIENGLMAIIFLYLFLLLNKFRGKALGAFRTIGRYSLYVMCVHSVEMIGIPWYIPAEIFGMHKMVGFFVIYCSRLLLIFFVCFIITRLTALSKKKKQLI